MPERTLRNCRILVVEDEYFLADELRTELRETDAIVLGPVGTVAEALMLVRTETEIDGAILDMNLRGEMAFPVADLLAERSVPLLFVTGYDEAMIPARYADVARCEKPISMPRVIAAIGRLVNI